MFKIKNYSLEHRYLNSSLFGDHTVRL